MNLPLKGIIPPMITPLTEAGTLDIDGLNKLVEYLISGGVHGIFLLGTNGEAASLTYEFCKEFKDSPDFSILASTESFLPET